MYQNMLRYAGGRYAWVALSIVLLALLVFLSQSAVPGPSGSTWQGYALGVLSAILVFWLAALGVRKRRYATAGLLQRWVSAHIYIGLAVVGVVLFHSAAELGWNVHSGALLLLIVTVISGVVGCVLYLVVPGMLADNRDCASREEFFIELGELNTSCLNLSKQCAPNVELAVQSSLTGTYIGGGVFAQLFGQDHSTILSPDQDDTDVQVTVSNQGQHAIYAYVAEQAPKAKSSTEARALSSLVSMVARRQVVLRRIRRDIQLQSWLSFWLYLHVPTSVAMLMALFIHIVVVFFYW